MTRFVSIDLETSGLNPQMHEIIEVGIAVEVGRRLELTEFSLPMLHPQRADLKALDINGYGIRDFAPEWSFRDARSFLAAALDDAHLVGKNPSFDAGFLTELFQVTGLAPMWHHRLVDVGMLAWGWYNRQLAGHQCEGQPFPPNSERVAELMGVPLPTTRHTALADAEWAHAVFRTVVPWR